MIQRRFVVLLVFFFTACAVFAQSNDVAVSFGGTFSPGAEGPAICEAILTCPAGIVSRGVDPGFSIEGTYAHRLANFKVSSLHLELPFMFSPARKSEFLAPDFSTFFLTPSLRLKFLPSSGVSPFLSAGGGLGRFKQDSVSDNHWAFQLGGGLDFKTRLPLLGFRIEARDFVAGPPSFSTLTNNHLNNLFVGGGIVFHF
jgi:opacity protein-like surface antigen